MTHSSCWRSQLQIKYWCEPLKLHKNQILASIILNSCKNRTEEPTFRSANQAKLRRKVDHKKKKKKKLDKLTCMYSIKKPQTNIFSPISWWDWKFSLHEMMGLLNSNKIRLNFRYLKSQLSCKMPIAKFQTLIIAQSSYLIMFISLNEDDYVLTDFSLLLRLPTLIMTDNFMQE
jgi:hypothetical protein